MKNRIRHPLLSASLYVLLFGPWVSFPLLGTPSAAQVIAGLRRPEILPPGHLDQWFRVSSSEDIASLKDACGLTDEQVDAMLVSDDPLDRGLGLFVLDQRSDVRRLLEVRHLLNDDAATIPTTGRDTGIRQGEFFSYSQTIGEYLSRILNYWIRNLPADRAELDLALSAIDNPDHLVQMWVIRLQGSYEVSTVERYHPDVPATCYFLTSQVKASIRLLPPDIRWVVVCTAKSDYPNSYADAEILEVVASAASELGGHIDPNASPAWTQPGMTQKKGAAHATLQRVAPQLIAQP